ncbi:MAG: cob(I)yrinic acid a,c-diamide adenosyltransferase [Oligoflexia bacterium]|nr:cob(I)yrinic acid a,c-diamide adenosyltransferase [Oligoflexia bacterium]
MSQHGQIHVYTGDGKGKTTSAVGLAVRASGAGRKVCFIQFDKGHEAEDFYSERKVLQKLSNFDIHSTGKIRMMPSGQFRFTNSPPDFEEAQRGLKIAVEAIRSGKYGLIVCDEILSCLLTGLLQESEVENLVKEFDLARCEAELVLTGRSLPAFLKERADLITEMKPIKHYFNKGLPARRGIEF